jgi:hypothetical protein
MEELEFKARQSYPRVHILYIIAQRSANGSLWVKFGPRLGFVNKVTGT